MRVLLSVLLLLVVALSSVRVEAQPKVPKTERSEAARLKKDADAQMDQDHYADALALYARAYELTADPVFLYNQGRAFEAMGEYPDALDRLERFEREAAPALRAKVPGLHDLLADLRGRIATVLITTNAPNARLFVRDKAAGTIQKEMRLRTRAGTASIEVVAEGFVTYKREIDLAGGSVVKIEAQLVPRKADALVIVKTRPSANILIDGKGIGRAPLEMRLKPGEHELVAEAKGMESERVPMTLALGDRRELDLELHEPPGLLTRWWFWTGVGVVVAGAAAASYALLTERQPERGSFGNGVITGP